MKKTILFLFVMFFTLSATMAFADEPEKKLTPEKTAAPAETENKISDEEIERISTRIEEIRDMDKSDMTSEERRELRKELKELRKEAKSIDGGIYIGGGALIVIILVLILLT
jgi:hypothetical protein